MSIQNHINETNKHIKLVRSYLMLVSKILNARGKKHDQSKLENPEQDIFVEYTPKLKNCTYGSEEYKTFLAEMKPALDHHYSNNHHHPEYFKNGINDMNLIDIMEMFFDWMAATKRHDNGDINKSIEINKNRFKYDDLLSNIFKNTVDCINRNWFFDEVEKIFDDNDNDNIREIVYEWFTGGSIFTDEYKSKYSSDDFDKAHSIVSTLVSMGLG